jgi:hypothetical protein
MKNNIVNNNNNSGEIIIYEGANGVPNILQGPPRKNGLK